MMINSDEVLAYVGLASMTFYYIGKFTEYARKDGTYELRREIRASYRENERLRQELFTAGIALGAERHPASRALPELSVKVERPHLSLIKSEKSS